MVQNIHIVFGIISISIILLLVFYYYLVLVFGIISIGIYSFNC